MDDFPANWKKNSDTAQIVYLLREEIRERLTASKRIFVQVEGNLSQVLSQVMFEFIAVMKSLLF